MKKLKKKTNVKKENSTERSRHAVKTFSKPRNKRSTKGEVYRARHSYEQTYLDIRSKRSRKRTFQDIDEPEASKEGQDGNRLTTGKDCADSSAAPTTQSGRKARLKKYQDDSPIQLFSKVQRRKLHNKAIKELQKEKLKEKEDEKKLDFSRFKDEVRFGEVVSAPPQLTAKPRGTAPITNKPGKRELLLKSLISNKNSPSTADVDLKSTKRKLLTPGQRRIIETEQQRVIDAYRKMKKNK